MEGVEGVEGVEGRNEILLGKKGKLKKGEEDENYASTPSTIHHFHSTFPFKPSISSFVGIPIFKNLTNQNEKNYENSENMFPITP